MSHFKMTDKTPTKTVPCAYPGCEHTVEVTKFLAAKKARCPEHEGKAAKAVSMIAVEKPTDAPPVHDLPNLVCPFCKEPMLVKKVEEGLGFITIVCGSPCMTAIEIKPSWSPCVMQGCPPELRPLIDAINKEQAKKGGAGTKKLEKRLAVGRR